MNPSSDNIRSQQERPPWPVGHGERIYRDSRSGRLVGVREVVHDTEGNGLDEVVSEDLHLEQMDENLWWMSVNGIHVWFRSDSPIEASVLTDAEAPEEIDSATVQRWHEEHLRDLEERHGLTIDCCRQE